MRELKRWQRISRDVEDCVKNICRTTDIARAFFFRGIVFYLRIRASAFIRIRNNFKNAIPKDPLELAAISAAFGNRKFIHSCFTFDRYSCFIIRPASGTHTWFSTSISFLDSCCAFRRCFSISVASSRFFFDNSMMRFAAVSEPGPIPKMKNTLFL